MQMQELEAENRRLRSLVSSLSERLRGASPSKPTPCHPSVPLRREVGLESMRSSVPGTEQCGGALVGRFASVRGNRR